MSGAPIFDRVCRDRGFAHIDRPLGTITAPRVEKLPDLVVVRNDRNMPSVRLLPLTGQQSPGRAW